MIPCVFRPSPPPPPTKHEGLLAVKVALGNPPELSTWTTGDPCAGWARVTCNDTLVVGLDLSYLTLSLPKTLPEPLAYMHTLRAVSLAGNGLSGSLLPDYSLLTELTSLRVDGNALYGRLPDEWAALSRLATLNLGMNQLSGPIPAGWPAGMTMLTRLTTSNNTIM